MAGHRGMQKIKRENLGEVWLVECLTARKEAQEINAVLPGKYQTGCCSQNHWQCYIPTGSRGRESPEDEGCR